MIISTLCYIEKDGCWLMLHRVKKKNDVNHDKWIGVGGKFEEGESPEDCLLREVREETGLTLTEYRFLLSCGTPEIHWWKRCGMASPCRWRRTDEAIGKCLPAGGALPL